MVRIITIPFSHREEGFSDKELNVFVRNKKGIQYQAELATLNQKDFNKIPNLSLLDLKNLK